MNHMTDTGAKGLDLYCLQKNGDWRFVNSARPKGKTNQVTIIKNMHPEEREYMLYLPLYDGLISLSIGVDSLATISQPLVEYQFVRILLFLWNQYSSRRLCFTSGDGTYQYHIKKIKP